MAMSISDVANKWGFWHLGQFARDSRVNAVRNLYRIFLAQNRKEGRGLRLMRDWLSPDQRERFDKSGYFDVIGCTTGTKYRIHHHAVRTPNVYELDDIGRCKMGICFALAGRLAKGDIMLAQKIALETDEQNALSAANRVPATRQETE